MSHRRHGTWMAGWNCSCIWQLQQQSKVCIQACALLYIAAFCCTPNCHGIMSQLITGNYVIKFERNRFRVQLSARGIATCFASAQPKSQVSGGVDCLCLCLCLPSKSKSKSQIATTLANFLAPASDCTENRGLLVAQALLQLTAKLAQQANSLSSVKMLWLTTHYFFVYFFFFGLQGRCQLYAGCEAHKDSRRTYVV